MSQTETHSFDAEIAKVLHLMIHSLYTNRDIFLRELISNASDACDKLRYQALTEPNLLKEDPELGIRITINKKEGSLTIADNGIGMNKEELIRNLGTIAKSGTQEFLKSLSGDNKRDLPLIGQFGVGFYSSFMVADKVSVVSRKAGESEGWLWESEGTGQYSISAYEGSCPRGTQITLQLKKDAAAYLDYHKLGYIVETYSDHISFPVTCVDEEGTSHTLNKASALWVRQKSEITAEQYKEFYRHVAHAPEDPWMILHNKAEGKIEYTHLLYIPGAKPFDLFHPDRKRRVKLYVKRVFITDEGANLVPQYLRFLRGVVDSEDLPLNISRETLQHNPVIDKIRESLTKKVLGELKKKAEKEPNEYAAFWQNFGAVLKEGLCEAIAPKEQILEVCRFDSTHASSQSSLDEYISRMKPEQEFIYYLTGDHPEALKRSPQLEGFRAKEIEVLLLSDHVDDFWVNVTHEYKGKKFKSVTRAHSELDALNKEDKAQGGDKKELENSSGLIAALKLIYGDAVKDVRISNKLAESPVCLAIGDHDMDIRLERFLREQKQLPNTAYAKILEINPSHPIVQSLERKVTADPHSEEVKDLAWLLLDQARLLEGEELQDASAFSRRMNAFVQKSLEAA